jgi:hypothetical protein
MLDDRVLATVINYDGIIAVVRGRMRELGITNATLEHIAGLPDGYIAKLLGASRIRNLGPNSFDGIVQGLGMKLIAVEDAKATEKMRPRWTQRKKSLPLLPMLRTPPRATWLFTPRSGRKAALARAKKLSAAERSAISLNAITTRWQREREKERHRCKAAARPA